MKYRAEMKFRKSEFSTDAISWAEYELTQKILSDIIRFNKDLDKDLLDEALKKEVKFLYFDINKPNIYIDTYLTELYNRYLNEDRCVVLGEFDLNEPDRFKKR